MILVHLACNDLSGVFTGNLLGIEFSGSKGVLLKLEPKLVDECVSFEWLKGGLRFEAESGGVRWFDVHGRAHWTGNIHWEATSMEWEEAHALAEHLIRHGYTVRESARGPWERFRELERRVRR